MQFNFDCEQALGCNEKGFAILEGSFESNIRPGFRLFVNEILDSMGLMSSQVQGLQVVKTSAHKFFISRDRIIIKAEKNCVIGFIRTGNRKLFIKDNISNYVHEEPISVIDFFVHPTYERQGHGKVI